LLVGLLGLVEPEAPLPAAPELVDPLPLPSTDVESSWLPDLVEPGLLVSLPHANRSVNAAPIHKLHCLFPPMIVVLVEAAVRGGGKLRCSTRYASSVLVWQPLRAALALKPLCRPVPGPDLRGRALHSLRTQSRGHSTLCAKRWRV
jgi:hypothetical protein